MISVAPLEWKSESNEGTPMQSSGGKKVDENFEISRFSASGRSLSIVNFQVVQHYSHRALDDDMRSQMALDWIAREQVLIIVTIIKIVMGMVLMVLMMMMVLLMVLMMMVMLMVLMMVMPGNPGNNCARVEPRGERP